MESVSQSQSEREVLGVHSAVYCEYITRERGLSPSLPTPLPPLSFSDCCIGALDFTDWTNRTRCALTAQCAAIARRCIARCRWERFHFASFKPSARLAALIYAKTESGTFSPSLSRDVHSFLPGEIGSERDDDGL